MERRDLPPRALEASGDAVAQWLCSCSVPSGRWIETTQLAVVDVPLGRLGQGTRAGSRMVRETPGIRRTGATAPSRRSTVRSTPFERATRPTSPFSPYAW